MLENTYSVGGIPFNSKIRACIHATQTNQDVIWNFNKEFFSSYDWSKEPNKSLDQLYDDRAKQLREKYDYIILSYSGGSDSHNILMSFIRQGLHIDEIVVNHMSTAWNKFIVLNPNQTASWNTGAEHELQAMPRLKEVEHLIPRTKITILDLTENLFEAFTSYGDASWVLDRKEGLNPLNVTRYNYAYFKDIRKQFDKNHKIAMVVGVEKPRTFIKDNQFYVFFIDRAVNIVPIDDHFSEYTNSSLEFFYWSPDAVDIVCKQAHVIKRFIEANKQYLELWKAENATASSWRLIKEPLLKPILYSTWNQRWFQTDKSVSDWHGEFDTWFTAGYKDHAAYTIWRQGLDYVTKSAGKYVKNKPDGTPDGLTPFIQSYKIGPMSIINQ